MNTIEDICMSRHEPMRKAWDTYRNMWFRARITDSKPSKFLGMNSSSVPNTSCMAFLTLLGKRLSSKRRVIKHRGCWIARKTTWRAQENTHRTKGTRVPRGETRFSEFSSVSNWIRILRTHVSQKCLWRTNKKWGLSAWIGEWLTVYI